MPVLQMIANTEEPEAKQITFEDFWEIYPKKMARKVARESWKKINPKEHQAVLEGVMRARKSEQWMADGGKYIPFPATYLNQERWADELEILVQAMSPCNWPRCKAAGSQTYGSRGYCEAHVQAFKRGETP